jgi:hypothetical protein
MLVTGVFFVIGMGILAGLDVARGRRAALEAPGAAFSGGTS